MPEEQPLGTPESEKKSHTGLIVAIVLIVIVVLLALFFGLYFGLRNKGGDIPDEVNPDPDIVEPGPEEDPDGGDDDGDGEPEHTHTYGDWQYDDTYHWKECSECGDIIDKEEHTLEYINDEVTDKHYQECPICGYTSEEEDHIWIETSNEPATCTTDGEVDYKCELCGATKEVTINYLGHSWGEWEADNDTTHTRKCQREGCSATQTENHKDTTTIVSPTCTEGGYTLHTCDVCGNEYESNITSATGHTYNGTYVSDGEDGHHEVCTVCGECSETTPHDLVGVVTTQATADSDGEITYTCTATGCSYSYTETIEKGTFATDSWEEIAALSEKGFAQGKYSIGDQKTITLKDVEDEDGHSISISLRIIGFDHDTLSDGSGTAGMTIEAVNVFPSTYKYTYEYWAAAGGLRDKMQPGGEIYNLMPDDLLSVVKPVNKYSCAASASSTLNTTSDYFFLLSLGEIYSSTGLFESASYASENHISWYPSSAASAHSREGSQYEYYQGVVGDEIMFETIDDLVHKDSHGNKKDYWLRSSVSGGFARTASGQITPQYSSAEYNVCPVFCV